MMTRNEMDARDFFNNLVSTDANCPVDVFAHKYSREDLLRFAEAYHQAKAKEIKDKLGKSMTRNEMNEIIKEQIRQEDQPTLCPDCKEPLGDCDCKIELGEPDKLPEHPLMYGWICPRCGTVHSPFTTQCFCPPPTRTWIGRLLRKIGESVCNDTKVK